MHFVVALRGTGGSSDDCYYIRAQLSYIRNVTSRKQAIDSATGTTAGAEAGRASQEKIRSIQGLYQQTIC